jgi:hypothetical protein
VTIATPIQRTPLPEANGFRAKAERILTAVRRRTPPLSGSGEPTAAGQLEIDLFMMAWRLRRRTGQRFLPGQAASRFAVDY